MTELKPEELVDQLTLEEQVSLMSGGDVWSLPSIARLGLGSLRFTDGPNGARGSGSLVGGVKSSAFPVGISLGATWDPALLSDIGAAIADEVHDKGAHVLLGPTINMQRGPLNGRNFECYSEDPVLTAALAVGYVTGLQGRGVAATPKHFVGNESEIERTTISSEIDERTLRELHLVPFEAAVKKAGAWAVMSSYNRLNGTYTAEDRWLLTEMLRGDWGCDGVVMSDWFGSHTTVETVMAGLDLEMPGPPRDRGDKLVAAVREGRVPAETVRESALRVLRLMQRTGALTDMRPHEEIANERPATRALIRRAGAEGAVLLKNDSVLPLAGSPKIALIGPNAKTARCMGGGSSQLNAHRQVSPWDGLAEAIGKEQLTFARGCTNHRFEPVLKGAFRTEWFANRDFAGAPVLVEEMDAATGFWQGDRAEGRIDDIEPFGFSLRLTGSFTPERSGLHHVGVHCAGRARVMIDGKQVVEAWESWTRGSTFFEEGCDERIGAVELEAGRSHEVVIEFAAADPHILTFSAVEVGIGRPLGDAEIAEAARIAAEADIVVLCIGRNAEWDTEGWDLPSMRLPGRQDELAHAVARAAKKMVVLLQTGGPVEMPWADEVDAILQAWYPGQEAGHAIADVLLGRAEPAGRLPQSFPARLADAQTQGQGAEIYPGKDGKVVYAEGVFTGYRHHDRTGIAPLFAFGHGLGYAEIDISTISVEADTFEAEGTVRVRVTLENDSDRAGSQVVQLYVAPHAAPVERPEAELKAFAKVRLEPKERREISLQLEPRDFAWYSTERGEWVVSPGSYDLRVGLSAIDHRHVATVARASKIELPR